MSSKISSRPSASLPIATSETLGIIQSGIDKKIAVSDLGTVINIKAAGYGAVGDGVTDDTAAVQAAYTAAVSGQVVYWPGQATYKIVGTLALRTAYVTTVFGGSGQDAQIDSGSTSLKGCCINHAPTAAGVLFDVATSSPSTTVLKAPRFLGECLVYSTEETFSKVAFKLQNVSRPYFARTVQIGGTSGHTYRGSTGGDGGSVGIYFLGREQLHLDGMHINAQVCLRIGKNPDGSNFDLDSCSLDGVALASGTDTPPGTLPWTNILIDNNVRISIACFGGPQISNFSGGNYSLYWAPTTMSTQASHLTLRNWLTEQLQDVTKYSVNINIDVGAANGMDCLTCENCVFTNGVNGVFTNRVGIVNFDSCSTRHTAGQFYANCGNGSTISWHNLDAGTSSPMSIFNGIDGLKPEYISTIPSGYSIPRNATFSYSPNTKGNTGATPVPTLGTGSIQKWTQNSNVTWGIPTFPITVPEGQQLTLIVTKDATANSYTVAWTAPQYRNAPTFSTGTTASVRATYMFIFDGNDWQYIGGSSAFALP